MAGERILIVDDEPAILDLCAAILAREGYQVTKASRGRQAMALLDAEPFDLLMVDINLPEIDGLTVLRYGRQVDPNLTAVVVTAYATLENAVEALNSGARGFVPKPFAYQTLVNSVAEALNQRQREQERLRLKAQLPILQMAQTLMAEGDLRTLAGRLLEALGHELAADTASLCLLDERTNILTVAGAVGLPSDLVGTAPGSADFGALGQVLRSESPVVFSLQETDDRPLHFLAGPQASTIAGVPLRVGKKVVGLLTLTRRQSRPAFTSADVNLLTILGGQVAAALENARLYGAVARAKQEWEATFDAIADGISIHDETFRIVRVNRALAERLGQSPDELVGRPCFEVFHATKAPPEECPFLQVLASGRPEKTELQVNQLGGFFQLSVYPLYEDNKFRGVVHVARDITLAKRMEKELIQTEKLAALGRLVASLAHEINNPLQALRSGLRLLGERQVSEDKRQQYVKVASREVERLIAIVERVLGFYRSSAGRTQQVDVNGILEETLALTAKQLEHSQVVVHCELADNLPAIWAPGDQIKQVFLNIILNASQAMPDGGTLTIRSGWNAQWGMIFISFQDTGVGIPGEVLPRIFEPFYTTRPEGTGLGLAVSYSIVERLGGRIEVESEPGAGSLFTVLLPVSTGPAL